jgi:hypothetical protein
MTARGRFPEVLSCKMVRDTCKASSTCLTRSSRAARDGQATRDRSVPQDRRVIRARRVKRERPVGRAGRVGRVRWVTQARRAIPASQDLRAKRVGLDGPVLKAPQDRLATSRAFSSCKSSPHKRLCRSRLHKTIQASSN